MHASARGWMSGAQASAKRRRSCALGVGSAGGRRHVRRRVRQLERARGQRRHPILRQRSARRRAHRWPALSALRVAAAGSRADRRCARVSRGRTRARSGLRRTIAVAPIDIVRVSGELGASLIYVPSMRNGSSAADPAEDRGSAIVSTLPLSNPMAIELPGERQRRVVISAQIGTFSVAVVHLDALGGWNRLRLFWTPWMRDVQVRTTTSALPDPNGPLVVGADLNTWHGRDERAARHLARTVSCDAAVGRSSGSRTARARLHVLSRRCESARALPAGGTSLRIGSSSSGGVGRVNPELEDWEIGRLGDYRRSASR